VFIEADVIDALRINVSEIELDTIDVFENKTLPKEILFSCVCTSLESVPIHAIVLADIPFILDTFKLLEFDLFCTALNCD